MGRMLPALRRGRGSGEDEGEESGGQSYSLTLRQGPSHHFHGNILCGGHPPYAVSLSKDLIPALHTAVMRRSSMVVTRTQRR
jgi:hypothetical protein